jgi:hypothetical protein
VDPRVVLDTVVKRKIPSPRRESNPRIPIVQPVVQRYITIIKLYLKDIECKGVDWIQLPQDSDQ